MGSNIGNHLDLAIFLNNHRNVLNICTSLSIPQCLFSSLQTAYCINSILVWTYFFQPSESSKISPATSRLRGGGPLLQASYSVVLYTRKGGNCSNGLKPHKHCWQMEFNKATLWLVTISLAVSISLCIGIHSIPRRTQCYESCLSKQFNVNTVTLCGLCLSGYRAYRQKRSWLLWPLPAKALWHPLSLSLDRWSTAGQHPHVSLISISRPSWGQTSKHTAASCFIPWAGEMYLCRQSTSYCGIDFKGMFTA